MRLLNLDIPSIQVQPKESRIPFKGNLGTNLFLADRQHSANKYFANSLATQGQH